MKRVICMIILILLIAGCTTAPQVEEKEEETFELNIYNWEDYFGETTIEDFEAETGIKVNLFTFEDEELMKSDVQSHPGKYDLVIASGSLTGEMRLLKILEEINFDNIPNMKNVDSGFLNLFFDPEQKYSVPYMWGTTGVIINTKYVPEDSDSWSVLFDEEYTGKISMLNNPDEVTGAALKYLGYSLHTTNQAELDEIEQLLVQQKPLLKGYEDPITIRQAMIDEEIWVAHQYSGEALYAMDENEDLLYYIPKEGAPRWIDNFAIPIEAPNKKNAEKFINYILDAEVSAGIANYLWYANTNKAAAEFTNAEILEDETLYPGEDVMNNLESWELTQSPEVSSAHEKIWSTLQTT